jgi:protein-tyrosine-phosphatase
MGCGVACPSVPANHRDDWGLEDPSGGTLDDFRKTRDIIYKKVNELREILED